MANSAPATDSALTADLALVVDMTPFYVSTPAADSAPTVNIVSTGITKALKAEASSSQPPWAKTELSVVEKYQLVRTIGEECIQEDELRNLLAKKPNPIAYDGFVPSKRMHIAQGVMKVINVNELAAVGCTVKIWIADWFAELNNKMGGDMKKIQTVAISIRNQVCPSNSEMLHGCNGSTHEPSTNVRTLLHTEQFSDV